MNLAHSVVPVLLFNGSALVKGRGFASDRVVGNPVQQARVYTSVRDVDELVLLDVRATIEGRGPSVDLIRQVSETCFVPLSYGGGVRSVEDAAACIEAGAEKVILGSAPVLNPGRLGALIGEISIRWGSNAVTASVDFRRVGDDLRLAVRSGSLLTSMNPLEWAQLAVAHGAGEILLQAIDRDGTLDGYDIPAIAAVRQAIPGVRLVASGGASSYEDLARGLDAGADAVAAGALWTFTDATPQGARTFLAQRGYEVRPPARPWEVTA